MEEEKVLDNIVKSVSNRLKVPIIVTYICVLVIYNWDILFFLFFENISAGLRIEKIKIEYGNEYYKRILVCLAISIGLILLFTILNTLLNSLLKSFYRKDKEISSEIENYENISLLTQQLSQSIEKTKKLESEIKDLRSINANLVSKKINLKTSDISEKDYKNFLSSLNNQTDKEKLLFSFKELLNAFKSNNNIKYWDLINKSTYDHTMKDLISKLESRKLLEVKEKYDSNTKTYYDEFILSKSFDDFLKMDF